MGSKGIPPSDISIPSMELVIKDRMDRLFVLSPISFLRVYQLQPVQSALKYHFVKDSLAMVVRISLLQIVPKDFVKIYL